MKKIFLPIFIGFTLVLIQGCGGGGGGSSSTVSVPSYSGLTTEARIEDANAETLSTAAASGAAQSVVADSFQGVTPRASVSLEKELVEISPRLAQWIVGSGSAYAARDVSAEFCDAGGSADLDANADETVGTITFSNCGIRVDATSVMYLTGTVDYTITVVGGVADSLSMTFRVNATYQGETAAINLALNCVDLSGSPSCSVRSDFTGLDGRVYRVVDIDVTSYGADTYSVNATVYDPDHGRFSMITTAPLVLDCANGVPSTGTVEINGADSTSGIITFVSCAEFNVSTDGGSTSTTYNWP